MVVVRTKESRPTVLTTTVVVKTHVIAEENRLNASTTTAANTATTASPSAAKHPSWLIRHHQGETLVPVAFTIALLHQRSYPDDNPEKGKDRNRATCGTVLQALKDSWQNTPPNWKENLDPCSGWDGITCKDSRIVSIILTSMGLSGNLSGDIGQLTELQTLDLSYNNFTGPLTPKIGNLKKLKKLLLVDCDFSGPLPVTLGSLANLSSMSLNLNAFTGGIPPSIGNLENLYWLDLADNQLSGSIPVSSGNTPGLDRLINAKHFHFGGNKLSGAIPEQLFHSNMKLIHLLFENNQLNGTIPDTLGLVTSLEVLRLDGNFLTGTVPSKINSLTDLVKLLVGNPICMESGNAGGFCSIPTNTDPPYSTSNSCTSDSCKQDEVPNPRSCRCAYPYTGNLTFRASSNTTTLEALHKQMMDYFNRTQLPVDTVSLSNPRKVNDYLVINLQVFSSEDDQRFNWSGISSIGFSLSDQTFKTNNTFEAYFFQAEEYHHFFVPNNTFGGKSSNTVVIVGLVVGGFVFVALLVLAGIYAMHKKDPSKRTPNESSPFALWDENNGIGAVPQLKGTKAFSFQELSKYTNNFSESNNIGTGGYGMVYKGRLPNGQLVAIKRATMGSTQGGLEFKTEIELLSRVHHKNLVSLIGFCFDQGEQMLVYEFIVNGTVKDSLSGRSGFRIDWIRRLQIALGSAKGLQYLHDLADPPIIHRDVKTNNILLDERLVAKVADFGLSKSLGDANRTHITTQVKGTLGYMDPEYYMTNQLTEKSDVYSFGVVLLELITARNPIEKGKYIVREVKQAMDSNKELYNLQDVLDPTISLTTQLKGLERFVDIALQCVEETGDRRPTMSEVVKEIESIMEFAGLNPNVESVSNSAAYDYSSKGSEHPYTNDNLFAYSGDHFPTNLDPM